MDRVVLIRPIQVGLIEIPEGSVGKVTGSCSALPKVTFSGLEVVVDWNWVKEIK